MTRDGTNLNVKLRSMVRIWLLWVIAAGSTGLALLPLGSYFVARQVRGEGSADASLGRWGPGLAAFFPALGLAMVVHAVNVWLDRRSVLRCLNQSDG